MNNEIQKILDQLKDLKLRETQLRIEEGRIIKRLQEAHDNRRRNAARNPGTAHQDIFETGDRVRITNRYKVSNQLQRTSKDGDRFATVTSTYKNKRGKIDKVYILTDNGFATWRLPENLQRL